MAEASRPSEQEITIARVYAQALLSLAEQQGLSEAVLEEIESLLDGLDRNPAFESFLASPLVDTEERRKSLDRILRGKLSELLLDTLQVMNQKGRSGLVRALAQACRQEYEELRGLIRVQVRSAVQLTDDLRRQLERAVSEYTGKRATLQESVDESLIGGIVLHVADRKVDSSVANELRKLGRKLLDRASQEIHSGRNYFEEVT